MPDKKYYSREEFEDFRKVSVTAMIDDADLQRESLNVLVQADHHNWIHQTNWFGEPILNLPQDMFALQEIIFQTRPDYIIEVGVAWGGSLLFYSTLLESLGGEKIIGIDLYIPEDLKQRLAAHGKLSRRIALINGSSIDPNTIAQIQSIIGNSRNVMVILDSFHTHDHVLKELRLYSSFIRKNNYLVCCDTIVEYIPVQAHRPRPWGPGNSPKTAVDQFIRENGRFIIDRHISDKLLFTCNPGGYLKCID